MYRLYIHIRQIIPMILSASPFRPMDGPAKPHVIAPTVKRTLSLCFPVILDSLQFGYIDCCRNWGTFGATDCFSNRSRSLEILSVQQCCIFPFSPKLPGIQQLPGLPSTLLEGGMTFSMGSSKDLQLRIDGVKCAIRDNYKKCGSDVLWLDSWYFGRLLSSLFISPRQVLDIGCGLGLTSVTAAKLGHNVTSTDVDPAALRATKQNAARNGVNLAARTWNFSLPYPESVQQRGPFDIGVFSAGMGIFSLPRGANPQRLDDLRQRVGLKLARMLAKLPVKAFYLKCKGTPKGRRLQPCLYLSMHF